MKRLLVGAVGAIVFFGTQNSVLAREIDTSKMSDQQFLNLKRKDLLQKMVDLSVDGQKNCLNTQIFNLKAYSNIAEVCRTHKELSYKYLDAATSSTSEKDFMFTYFELVGASEMLSNALMSIDLLDF